MEAILTEFTEKCTEIFYEVIAKITEDSGDISDLTMTLKDNFDKLGIEMVRYALEMVDNELCNNKMRKKSWSIDKSGQEKTLTTIFGDVKYKRTYFVSKFGKGYSHLADRVFGIEPHERCDLTIKTKMLENVVDLSYEKSGNTFSTTLSKQTVLNTIRKVENKRLVISDRIEKAKVKTIYVEADEDHVALQDGRNVMPYLVYVHEGYVDSESKRKELKNVRYFSGMYKQSDDLWIEVADYLEDNYDISYIETVYLSGDGASWIKQGKYWLPKVKPVLDKYHLNKYVIAATAHIPEMRSDIWKAINTKDMKGLKAAIAEVLTCVDSEQRAETVIKFRTYINSNWEGIKNAQDELAMGCSAEGHISHILSDRLSSRPLGWCIVGVDDMARLRAFRANGGKIFDVLKGQKRQTKHRGIKKITANVVKKIEKVAKVNYTGIKPTTLQIGKKTALYEALHKFCYAI